MRRKTPQESEVPDFRRAARQRLKAARYLLESEDFRLEAIYLALYAAECALKSLILARLREDKREAMVTKFIKDGEKSHYFPYLKDVLERDLDVRVPSPIVEQVQVIAPEWKTGLRYMAGRRGRDKARPFIDAATSILEWTEKSS